MPWLFAPCCELHCSGGTRAPLQYCPTRRPAPPAGAVGTTLLLPNTFATFTASLKIELVAVRPTAPLSAAFGWMPPPDKTRFGTVVYPLPLLTSVMDVRRPFVSVALAV